MQKIPLNASEENKDYIATLRARYTKDLVDQSNDLAKLNSLAGTFGKQ